MPAIPHAGLQQIYSYWSGKRGDRRMPSRADIDPVEIPCALWPNIMIVAVEREGARLRFRYRRVGSVFTEAFGRDPTGGFLDETLPETSGYRDYVLGIYAEVAARGRPIYTENTFALENQALPMLTKRLTLPLSSDGHRVDVMMTGHSFEYDRIQRPTLAAVDGLEPRVRLILEDGDTQDRSLGDAAVSR